MGWEQEQLILQKLNTAQAGIDYLMKQFNTFTQLAQILAEQIPALANGIVQLEQDTKSSFLKLDDKVSEGIKDTELCCSETQKKLTAILKVLLPPPATSFTAVITLNSSNQGDNNMATKKSATATADLQVNDATGTFTVTLAFADADGVPTAVPAGLSASYVASDATPGPSALTLAPSADTSSAAGSVTQSTIQALVAAAAAAGVAVVLPTGLTVSVTANWTGLASPLTVVAAPPIDVVAGPASTFVATEA